jgi:hypothetical protein
MRFAAPDGLIGRPDTRRTEMDDTETRTRISQVVTVFVPVADQDRVLGLYLDK